jgi:4-alpha-glucanotransferase
LLLLLVQTAEFKQWYEDNQSWIQPYSAFCFLRDLFGSAEHWKWGSLSQPSQQVCSEMVSWLLSWNRCCTLCCKNAARHDIAHV